jgi:hypothetical protein
MKRILLLLWLTACLGVLVLAIVRRADPDIDLVCTYFLFFLSFPAGFAVALFFGLLSHFASLPAGLGFILIAWPLFVALGYGQWFIFVPWGFRKAKSLRHASRP